ncbi:ISSpo9, transposase [Sagittula stellata E-37]|uniref:ISSpo9, transposase n=1 Tax=Sagittula stellata (strain ATCC 700073 / DSM 11524 / E-37) TaxID=388399 RepID=A3JZ97_SAGS3|nr:ISSpo9, transposase [Sagittula stellata E-37]
MPRLSPTRYRTTDWSEYDAALRRRGSLSVWFDPDTVRHAGKTGKRGRPETFSDVAIHTCLTLKGEGRLGNDPGDRFSPERAEPRPVRPSAAADGRAGREPDPDGWARLAGSGLFGAVPTASADRGQIPCRRSGKPLNLPIPSRDITARCTAGQRTARG